MMTKEQIDEILDDLEAAEEPWLKGSDPIRFVSCVAGSDVDEIARASLFAEGACPQLCPRGSTAAECSGFWEEAGPCACACHASPRLGIPIGIVVHAERRGGPELVAACNYCGAGVGERCLVSPRRPT